MTTHASPYKMIKALCTVRPVTAESRLAVQADTAGAIPPCLLRRQPRVELLPAARLETHPPRILQPDRDNNRMRVLCALALAVHRLPGVLGLDNGLALTPPQVRAASMYP